MPVTAVIAPEELIVKALAVPEVKVPPTSVLPEASTSKLVKSITAVVP